MFVKVDHDGEDTLTDQITQGIQRLVKSRQLRAETRIPSIRQFAAMHRVSKYTVVQAYDRLVASGYIQPRHGAGFFITKPAEDSEEQVGGVRLDKATNALWLIHQMSREHQFTHRLGSGWLPSHWLQDSGLDRALRDLSRQNVRNFFGGYGDARGFAPLREKVRLRLADIGVQASPDQILLTNGIMGGVDLAARYLIRPGDAVLVDDPGYYQSFGHMRALGARVHGVRWTNAGPDLEHLEELAEAHKPRLFLTTSIVQNPTGHTISQGTAFRLLQLAHRYDFYVIEDDVDATAHPAKLSRLAGLDELNRVVYANGFSKFLSPKLRVGYLAGHRDLIRDLVDLKLLTQAASSEVAERLVHQVLSNGQYRKHRARLIKGLLQARTSAIRRLEEIGIGPSAEDCHGLFAWMDFPGVADTTVVAETAAPRGMLLAPGAMFSPEMSPSTKMRFNVAYCQSDDVFRELESLMKEAT